MNDSTGFNQFALANGASILNTDEELILEKEPGPATIFWGSVYSKPFVLMPDEAFTSQAAYLKWCKNVAGFLPKKRAFVVWEEYIRQRMVTAKVREPRAGTEYGIEIDNAIEQALDVAVRASCLPNFDAGNEVRNGTMVWVETVDKDRGAELIIKINPLMSKINSHESTGGTEGKIPRTKVVDRLLVYGRQVGGRDASVNRLRCSYALPIEYLDEFTFMGLSQHGNWK